MATPPRGQQGDPSLRPCPRAPDFQQRVARSFDARAPRYDAGNTYHPPQAARLVRLAALRPAEEVLDVGTGTGYVALEAAELVGEAGIVTGVDLSDAMIHQAALKAQAAGLTNLRLLAVDIDECDFSPGRFDAILCSNALPFMPDIPASLARWRAWLKPGGRLAFNAPKGVGSRAYSVFVQLAASRGLLVEDPSAAFADVQRVRQLLATAGFAGCSVEISQEVNVRAGQTAQQWAASGWAQIAALPFADPSTLLDEAQLAQLQREYLEEAQTVAAQFATQEGIAEPYEMVWVLAHA